MVVNTARQRLTKMCPMWSNARDHARVTASETVGSMWGSCMGVLDFVTSRRKQPYSFVVSCSTQIVCDWWDFRLKQIQFDDYVTTRHEVKTFIKSYTLPFFYTPQSHIMIIWCMNCELTEHHLVIKKKKLSLKEYRWSAGKQEAKEYFAKLAKSWKVKNTRRMC